MCNGCGSIEGIELGKNYDFRVHLKSREARVEPRDSWHFTPLHPPPKTFFCYLMHVGQILSTTWVIVQGDVFYSKTFKLHMCVFYWAWWGCKGFFTLVWRPWDQTTWPLCGEG